MSVPPPEVRRNLSLAACEPCRKAKARCGHETPVCGRCRGRGLQDLCTYRSAGGHSLDGPEAALHLDSQNNARLEKRLRKLERNLHKVQSELRDVKSKDGSSRSSASLASVASSPSKKRKDFAPGDDDDDVESSSESTDDNDDLGELRGHLLFSNDLGFLGPTSPAAALRDIVATQAQFKSILENIAPPDKASPSIGDPSRPLASGDWRFCQARLDLAKQVLSALPPKPRRDQLLNCFLSSFDPVRCIIPRPWVHKFHGGLPKVLDQPDSLSSSDLLGLITRIESGESKSVHASRDVAIPVKWSFFGMLFAMLSIGTRNILPTENPYLPSDQAHDESRDAGSHFRELAGICWHLSNPLETVKEYSILLLYFYIMSHTLHGIINPYVWHLHGCLVTAATSIGLHREPSREEFETQFIRAQRRRSAYAAIYVLDKTLATFTGRPPLLYQRHSDTLPPFDITDEEVILPDPERGTAMASLNFGGWNRYGRVCPRSFLRAQLLVARVREDVLEIMLTMPDNVDPDSVSALHHRIRESYNTIPDALQHDASDSSPTDPSLHMQRVLLYLYSLENSFLLCKVVASRNKLGVNDEALLKASLCMFDTIISLWVNRAHYENLLHPLGWLLTTYALPSASIISSHLLQHHFSPSPSLSQLHLQDYLPQHLQSLSHYLMALSTLPSRDPHHVTCQKALGVFTRVEQILSTPVVTHMPQLDAYSHTFDPIMDIGVFTDPDPLSWMMGIDEQWMDFEESFATMPYEMQDDGFMSM